MSGTLYVVALPIGHLRDITLRAMDVLKSVDIVAAEDTRDFQDLAQELQIQTRHVFAYHDHNEFGSSSEIIEFLKSGKDVAIVSDAGTPSINDPGYGLLQKAFQENIKVVPVPGASSVTAALSVSPIGGGRFAFLGFAPAKDGERREFLLRLKKLEMVAVIFETPHRIQEHLSQAIELLDDPMVFVGREMTKTYEELLYQKASSLLQHFREPRGEFVLIYPPFKDEGLSIDDIKKEIQKLLDQGLSSKDILEAVKSRAKLARQDLYDLIQDLKSRKP